MSLVVSLTDGFFGVGGRGRGFSSSDTRHAWGRWTVALAAGIIEVLAFFLCSASRGDYVDVREEIPLEIAFFAREIYARLIYAFYRYYSFYCWVGRRS